MTRHRNERLRRLPHGRFREAVQVDARQVGHEPLELRYRLCLKDAVKPLLELLDGQPARGVVFAQQRRRPVPVVI